MLKKIISMNTNCSIDREDILFLSLPGKRVQNDTALFDRSYRDISRFRNLASLSFIQGNYPMSVKLYLHLGDIYRSGRVYALAKESYKLAEYGMPYLCEGKEKDSLGAEILVGLEMISYREKNVFVRNLIDLQKGIQIMKRVYSLGGYSTIEGISTYGGILLRLGHYEDALGVFHSLLDIDYVRNNAEISGVCYQNIANVHRCTKKYMDAHEMLQKSKACFEQIYHANHPHFLSLNNAFGKLYLSQVRNGFDRDENIQKAKCYFQSVLGKFRTTSNNRLTSSSFGQSHLGLSEIHSFEGNYNMAKSSAEQFCFLSKSVLSKKSPDFQRCKQILSQKNSWLSPHTRTSTILL